MSKEKHKFRLFLMVVYLPVAMAFSQEIPYIKVLFDNSRMPESHFYSKTGYAQNSWIKNIRGKLPVADEVSFTPGNALELHYISSGNGYWFADVNHINIRGMDHFKEADQLSFWLYPDTRNAKEALPVVSLLLNGDSTGLLAINDYASSLESAKWQRVVIPLADFKNEAGFSVNEIMGLRFYQGQRSEQEHRIFVDQIELIPDEKPAQIQQQPVVLAVEGYERHFDIKWKKVVDPNVRYIKVYRSLDSGESFQAVGVQSPWISGFSDFTGLPGDQTAYRISFVGGDYRETTFSNTIASALHTMTDEELLDMVQQSHFRYYWEGSESNSGLALENIPGRTSMIASGASGFGVMAILSGVKRGYIMREDAVARFLQIIKFLSKADRFHGAFPHFLDGTTGKVVPFFGPKDNGGDLVETSFLMQGLLAARQFFDRDTREEEQIRSTISTLWEEVEWDWYRKEPDSEFLFWHWSPDQEWVINHKLIGWNETMITYLLAIASPRFSVPPELYYTGWASQSEEAIVYRTAWGKTTAGSVYRNGNTYYGIKLPVGVSTGGPLFFIHYSYMGFDPSVFTDKYVNYFENNRKIAEINLRYCVENPENHQGYGQGFWGLTASDGPFQYSADEPKVEMDQGKMAPTGALSSFPYTPEASMKALKNFYRNYGHFLYGYYGFRDALNLNDQWCSPLYMGLNQAPVVVMIENYRSGMIWELFMQNPEIQEAVKAIMNLKSTNNDD